MRWSILIRPHPDTLVTITTPSDARIVISRKKKFFEDLIDCDEVVSGNSTVLLDCLHSGVYSYYWPDLDRYSEFRLPSIQLGFVHTLKSVDKVEFDAAIAFYNSPQWQDKLTQIFNVGEVKR